MTTSLSEAVQASEPSASEATRLEFLRILGTIDTLKSLPGYGAPVQALGEQVMDLLDIHGDAARGWLAEWRTARSGQPQR